MTDPGAEAAALARAGLRHFAWLSARRARLVLAGLSPEILSRYDIDPKSPGPVLTLAMPFGEGPEEPPSWARDWLAARPGPLARLARFARADWYGELVHRLRSATRILDGTFPRGLAACAGPRRGWRCLVNSGLPEKKLAAASGLGELGRNGLIMVRGLGSACVLGLLLPPAGEPWDRGEPDAQAPLDDLSPDVQAVCGSCGLCVKACPTGALSMEGGPGFARRLCIQHWSLVPGPLPPAVEAAWSDRLYGCDSCAQVCPRFRPDPGARTALGLLGPGLPASWFTESEDAEIKARLKKTVLGMGWMPIEAFRRNARLAMRAGRSS